MLRSTPLLLGVLVIPSFALAQGKPVAEIGTGLGVTISSANGETETRFRVPGGGPLGQPFLYASIFAGRSLVVEPQLALNILTSGGETLTTVGLVGQLAYLFKGTEVRSPFLAASFAVQRFSGGGGSSNDTALGAKAGYRLLVGTSLGVRVEAGYRRWFDSEVNEFTFGLSLGGIIHRQ